MDIIRENIYKVNKGAWRGFIKYQNDNEISEKWFRGNSSINVSDKIRSFKASIDKQIDKSRYQYSDFINKEYMPYKYRIMKKSSYHRLYSIYIHHCSNLDHLELSNIKTEDILNILDEAKSKNYSKSTLDKIYEMFNNSFKYAIQKGYIEKNPLYNIKKYSSNKGIKNILVYSVDEIRRIEEQINKKYYQYGNSLPLLWLCGLRIGELLALNKCDIDINAKTLNINKSLSYVMNDSIGKMEVSISTPKTQKGYRIIPLSEKALWYINKLMNDNDTEYLISTTANTRCNSRNYQRSIEKLLEDAKVEYKGLHAFRHTFATRLIELDVNVKKVSELIGHSSIKTTLDIYYHTDVSKEHSIVNMMF